MRFHLIRWIYTSSGMGIERSAGREGEGSMIKEAAEFAEKAHSGTFRKGSAIPYITHPLETAVIASMMSDDEELIAAALLHDTMEDAGVSYEELKKRFGLHVADLVAEETEDKTKSWLERKSRTIAHLHTARPEIKILTLADKLSNLRCTARDYLLIGEQIWERFNVKEKAKHAWYYTSMVELLRELNQFPEYQEYVRLCGKVFGTMAK